MTNRLVDKDIQGWSIGKSPIPQWLWNISFVIFGLEVLILGLMKVGIW